MSFWSIHPYCDPAAARALIGILQHGDAAWELTELFPHLGEAVVPFLIEALEHKNSKVVVPVIAMLGTLQHSMDEANENIRNALTNLQSDDPKIKAAVRMALS